MCAGGREEAEDEKRQATKLHFRRVEETLQILTVSAEHISRMIKFVELKWTNGISAQGEAPDESEKPIDSPIRRMIASVFARMRKHETHNPSYTHYYVKPT